MITTNHDLDTSKKESLIKTSLANSELQTKENKLPNICRRSGKNPNF
jgi:hypothetical protein